jgi:hypothetical protein
MTKPQYLAALGLLALMPLLAHATRPAKPRPAPPVVEAEPVPTETQLEIAPRVLTGLAACEFAQQVEVQAIAGRPGLFKLSYGKKQFIMLPQPTTTGAVRLEDRRTGMLWLQIPAKSMLMDQRAGRRLIDDCLLPEQRDRPAPVADLALARAPGPALPDPAPMEPSPP